MDNKTRVKIAVVIGIIILAVIFMFMVIFVKGNRTPVNKNIPTKTSKTYEFNDKKNTNEISDKDSDDKDEAKIALEDTESIGIRERKFVKINSDLKYEIIKKLETGYSSFCYGDGKIYELVANIGENVSSIIEIDLSDEDYPEKTIFSSSDYGLIDNMKYYSGKIYFVSSKGQLVEYSISEEHVSFLTNENEVSTFVIDEANNRIFVGYKPNGENVGIYVLDFTSNSYNQLVTLNELPGEMLINGNALVIDVKELDKIYVYNIEQQTILEIGSNNNLQKASYHVAFYDNYVLYTDGSKIDIKDDSGNTYKDDWYSLNDNSISSIAKISQSKLQISRTDERGQVSKGIIIDLTNGNAEEAKETIYSELITIK